MTGWHGHHAACNDRHVMLEWLRVLVAILVICAGSTVVGSPPAIAQTDPGPATTTTQPAAGGPAVDTEGTAAGDPAQAQLRWIMIGLLGLAGLILASTVAFWIRTRPPRVRVEEVARPVIAPPESEAAPPVPGAATAAPAGRPSDDAVAAALASMMAVDQPLPRPGPPQQ